MASQASVFERALKDFKKGLKKKDEHNFKFTTIDDLRSSILKLQNDQNSKRRLQNLNRLAPFLEAIEQYGKVVEVFCNSNEFVAFIWVCQIIPLCDIYVLSCVLVYHFEVLRSI